MSEKYYRCYSCKDTGVVEVIYADGGHGDMFLEPCKCKLKPSLKVVK
jgi:hypothetical protein